MWEGGKFIFISPKKIPQYSTAWLSTDTNENVFVVKLRFIILKKVDFPLSFLILTILE